jgi:hypothetical protein
MLLLASCVQRQQARIVDVCSTVDCTPCLVVAAKWTACRVGEHIVHLRLGPTGISTWSESAPVVLAP